MEFYQSKHCHLQIPLPIIDHVHTQYKGQCHTKALATSIIPLVYLYFQTLICTILKLMNITPKSPFVVYVEAHEEDINLF